MSSVVKGKFFTQIGGKHTGKTTYTFEFIEDLLRKNIVKRVLVLDRAVQADYDKYIQITTGHVPHLVKLTDAALKAQKKPVFVCRPTDEELKEFFVATKRYIRNTLLVYEDCTSFLEGTVPLYIKDVIFGNRNANNHVLFNFHSLEETPPAFFRNTDYIILRRTGDPPKLPNKVRPLALIQTSREAIESENKLLFAKTDYKCAFRIIDVKQGALI